MSKPVNYLYLRGSTIGGFIVHVASIESSLYISEMFHCMIMIIVRNIIIMIKYLSS